MKAVDIHTTDLQECVSRAQEERLIVTRNGHPVALVIGGAVRAAFQTNWSKEK